jgi:hypothetical protein
VTRAFRLHRYFLPNRVSTRLHQTVLRGQNQPARCLGLLAAALSRPRLRNSCVPHAGQAKQNDKITLLEAVSVRNNSSTRGQPRGFRSWFQLSLLRTPGNVSGANQSDEVGSGDAARRCGIPRVPLLLVRAARSSLAASVRSSSSPTRPAGSATERSWFHGPFAAVVGNHGGVRPSRWYSSTTA